MLHLSSLNPPKALENEKFKALMSIFMQITVDLSDFLEEKHGRSNTSRMTHLTGSLIQLHPPGLSWAPTSPTSLKGLVQEINFNQFIGVLLVHSTHLSLSFIRCNLHFLAAHRSAVPLRGTVATGDHLFSGTLGPEKPGYMMWCLEKGCVTWGTAMQYDIYWYVM